MKRIVIAALLLIVGALNASELASSQDAQAAGSHVADDMRREVQARIERSARAHAEAKAAKRRELQRLQDRVESRGVSAEEKARIYDQIDRIVKAMQAQEDMYMRSRERWDQIENLLH